MKTFIYPVILVMLASGCSKIDIDSDESISEVLNRNEIAVEIANSSAFEFLSLDDAPIHRSVNIGSELFFFKSNISDNRSEQEQYLVVVATSNERIYIPILSQKFTYQDSIVTRLSDPETNDLLYQRTVFLDENGDIIPPISDNNPYQGCYDGYSSGGSSLAGCMNCVVDIYVSEDLLNLVSYLSCETCIYIAAGISCIAHGVMGDVWDVNDISALSAWFDENTGTGRPFRTYVNHGLYLTVYPK